MRFLVLGASQRLGSYNQLLAAEAGEILQNARMTVDLGKYYEFMPPVFDDDHYDRITLPPAARLFIERLERADGLILSAPEYNRSISGSLKNLIDWTSCIRPYPFAGKPVMLLSATTSRRGGLLGLTQLQNCLACLGAYVYPQLFGLGQASSAFDEEKHLRDNLLRTELEQEIYGYLEMVRLLSEKER